MAAGQEQKKAAQLSPKPQQKNQPKLQTQPQPQPQKKQQHLPSQNTTSPTITKPQQQQTQQQQQQQQKQSQQQQQPIAKPQTVTIKQTIQPQKPLVTTTVVQPPAQPAQHPPTTSSAPTTQTRPIPSTSITSKVTEQIKSKLPQLPPRVQSQNSVTSRGPPPAIPPRSTNAPPLPNRSESVQIPSKSEEPSNKLTRQTSVNSIPPQFTPQPPPKFVIPQRQNSRTSLGRHNSVSGPSGSPTSTTGSPQMTRKH